MKKLILPIIALIAIGCSSSSENNTDVAVERTVEEINTERGDPCECIESKLALIDGLIEELNAEVFVTSDILNKALANTMDGCLATLGHVEADLAWAQQLKDCESFGYIRESMIEVKNAVMSLKEEEQSKFLDDVEDGGASGILDKLQDSAH